MNKLLILIFSVFLCVCFVEQGHTEKRVYMIHTYIKDCAHMGYRAAKLGISAESNPFVESNPRVSWLRGYMAYKQDMLEYDKVLSSLSAKASMRRMNIKIDEHEYIQLIDERKKFEKRSSTIGKEFSTISGPNE